jgi:L-cystine transport system substrate-binding protein
MLRRTCTLAAVLLLSALAGCGGGSTGGSSAGTSGGGTSGGSASGSASGLASGSASGEALKVGTEGTYAPFTFHDPKTNKLTGYDVEVTEAIGTKLGRPVQFSESTFDAIFAGLEASRYDVVANQISVNPERQAKYAFSKPYTVSTGVIVTRADDTSVRNVADIRGKTSAQSTTSNFAATARKAGAQVEAVEGFTQAVALLKQKRVDITINDSLAVLNYLRTSGDKGIKIAATLGDTTQQAFAFRKDSPLPAEFDKALDQLRADGTLAKISDKWFGEDVSGPAAR